MYPVALYGSLPEIAYLVPCGNFMTHPPAEEERPRRPPGRSPHDSCRGQTRAACRPRLRPLIS
jgi:hypothetical protein